MVIQNKTSRGRYLFVASLLFVSIGCLPGLSAPDSEETLLSSLLCSVAHICMGNESNLNKPRVSVPVLLPPAGEQASFPVSVSMTTATTSSVICYTLNAGAAACDVSKSACEIGSTEYTAPVSVNSTDTLTAIACKTGMDDSPITGGAYTVAIPPTLVSSSPANADTGVAVCSGSPCKAKIVLQFSESMQTTTPTLTTEVESATGTWVATPNTGTTFAWTQTTVTNDTLTITLSWHWFPENSNVRYTIAAADLKDVAANTIAAQVQQTFKTTWAGRNFTIADTGQTACYNTAGAVIACADASWPSQDADFANTPNARSFTGPTASGSDYTTKDNVTGLVWKSCSEGLSGAACATGTAATMTWNTAVNQCAALNTANSGAGYAGIKTWRLPTNAELETIVDYGVYNPAITSANFPATVANYYWSSSTYVNSTPNAWLVNFLNGYSTSTTKTNSNYVRCVSSGQPAVITPFTDNGDGTVTDGKTNLVWQKCSVGQNNDATCSGTASMPTWQAALTKCNTLVLAGKTWRLPSTNELLSLVDKSKSNSAIDTAFFPATVAAFYWSSSTYVTTTTDAWLVTFNNGSSANSVKTLNYYVRCVSGP